MWFMGDFSDDFREKLISLPNVFIIAYSQKQFIY